MLYLQTYFLTIIISINFERIVMYNRLHKFIEENNLIYNLQFGYIVKNIQFHFRQGSSHWWARGPCPPALQFPNQTRSKNFSFKHQGCCFLQMFRNHTDQKFHNFYRVKIVAIFGQFMAAFHFF